VGDPAEQHLTQPVALRFIPWQCGPVTEENNNSPGIPQQAELEARFGHRIITYDSGDGRKPGGQCSCCGSGPDAEPGWRNEPWYVYRAGFCDSDGAYMSMLCEGCLEELEHDYESRPRTLRDEMADTINHLLGDDIDGAQSMMDDLTGYDLDDFEPQ